MKRIALLILGCLLFVSAHAKEDADQSEEEGAVQSCEDGPRLEEAPGATAEIPPILQEFLRQNPGYHLRTVSDLGHSLDPQDCACSNGDSDACNIRLMSDAVISGKVKAFEVADTNHDGKPDVVAVVVKNKLFNVVVLQAKENAGTSAMPYWLVHDSEQPIFGVKVNGDYIELMDCADCDGVNNKVPTFAWTGSEYGKDVVLKGSSYIGSHQTIYSREDEHSPPVYKTGECEMAAVLALGKRQGDFHWHKVKLHNGKIGFVLNRQFIHLGNDRFCLFEK